MTVDFRIDCPACGRPNNAASYVLALQEPMTPNPGDVGVCILCAAVFELDAERRPRLVDEREWGAWPVAAEVRRVRRAIVLGRALFRRAN